MEPPPDRPPAARPVAAVVAGVVAAATGGAIYYLVAVFLWHRQALPLLIIGPIVGVTMRWIGRSPDRRLGYTAAALAVLASVAAFIPTDFQFFTPVMLDQTLRRLLSVQGVLLVGVSAYLAMLIAVARPDPT